MAIGTLDARAPSLMGPPLHNCSHSWEASLQMKSNTTNFTNTQAPRPWTLRDSTVVGCPLAQKLTYAARPATHKTRTTSHPNDSEGPRNPASIRGSPSQKLARKSRQGQSDSQRSCRRLPNQAPQQATPTGQTHTTKNLFPSSDQPGMHPKAVHAHPSSRGGGGVGGGGGVSGVCVWWWWWWCW